jgi:dolichol-phosphate mannosyltransferase
VRVLVVLPTYEEAATIGTVLRRLRSVVPDATLLVVDDNSPDGTAGVARAVADELGGVEIIVRPRKGGLGTAYREGFFWGLDRGYEAFVQIDSDLSHDPSAVPSLLGPLDEGYEVVIGSRYVPGGSIPDWTLHRRLLSRGGNIYSSLALGLRVGDATSGFRVYSESVLRRIGLSRVRSGSYGFQIECTYRATQAGARVKEVPIRFVDRVEGESKMSLFTVVEAFAMVTAFGVKRVLRLSKAAPELPVPQRGPSEVAGR